jgi:hypothetical protein
MRKAVLLHLALAAALLLASCDGVAPAAPGDDDLIWNKPYVLLNNIEVLEESLPLPEGTSPDSRLTYPRISGLKDHQVQDRINRLLQAEAERFAESKPASSDQKRPLSRAISWSVWANYNNLLNIEYYMFTSSEGLWENEISSLLFDLTTGDLLKLEDLFADRTRAQALVSSAIKKQILRENMEEEILYRPFVRIADDQPFALTDNGLLIRFPLRNPYFFGEMSFILPFSLFGDELVALGKYGTAQSIFEEPGRKKQVLEGPVGVLQKRFDAGGDGYFLTAAYIELENLPNGELQERLNRLFAEKAAAFMNNPEFIREAKENMRLERETYKSMFIFMTANFADILCIVESDSIFSPWNGEHQESRQTYLYNIRTGQPLALKDLFRDGVDYVAIINQYIREAIARHGPVDRVPFSTITEETGFYLDHSQLYIYGLIDGSPADSAELGIVMIPFEAFGEEGMIFY